MAPQGRAKQQSRDTRKTKKQSNQLSPSNQDDCKTRMDTKYYAQQNTEQLQNPTMGVTINNETITTELPL